MIDLAKKIMGLYIKRNWPLDWATRGVYIHLECSELIEAVRGKRGSITDEAGDVLICLMAITESQNIPWQNIVDHAEAKVLKLMDAPRYDGEEYIKEI